MFLPVTVIIDVCTVCTIFKSLSNRTFHLRFKALILDITEILVRYYFFMFIRFRFLVFNSHKFNATDAQVFEKHFRLKNFYYSWGQYMFSAPERLAAFGARILPISDITTNQDRWLNALITCKLNECELNTTLWKSYWRV
jgi:hypothetical protein